MCTFRFEMSERQHSVVSSDLLRNLSVCFGSWLLLLVVAHRCSCLEAAADLSQLTLALLKEGGLV